MTLQDGYSKSEVDLKLDKIESDMHHGFENVKLRFQHLEEEIDRRFEQVDKRFEQVDKRFEQVDKRFEQVDKRFEQIDRRFEQIEDHLIKIDNRFIQIDGRFNHLEKRFEQFQEQTLTVIGQLDQSWDLKLENYFYKYDEKRRKDQKVFIRWLIGFGFMFLISVLSNIISTHF
ncbi:hypothetical protein [Streptococcus sp. NLN64]|uniref:hypothetical protein n=1 Tax=Streptococcus sp. NLN64 TaxID=2822799 RepID=UPI0018CB90B9|nr:hypothetical protein [Streptococcus sp. NLN64]MBG9367653.1 hypothetical protein [Streptococcus sp. NLN64]